MLHSAYKRRSNKFALMLNVYYFSSIVTIPNARSWFQRQRYIQNWQLKGLVQKPYNCIFHSFGKTRFLFSSQLVNNVGTVTIFKECSCMSISRLVKKIWLHCSTMLIICKLCICMVFALLKFKLIMWTSCAITTHMQLTENTMWANTPYMTLTL